jgi:ribose-phosphate pyrophosphokinase
MRENLTGALVLGFPEYAMQARHLADAAGLPYGDVKIHRFPDGESRVRLPPRLPPQVIFCRSLDRPNEKLVELALAARSARTLGAADLTLVAPYLCYMRQDKAFRPGEAVSQQIVGKLLADWFDALITVDPHLHRVEGLQQAVPVKRATCLSAVGPMSDFVSKEIEEAALIGPDLESAQWVSAIAKARGLSYWIGQKRRFGDREVRISFPDLPERGRNLVLVDDVASTGRTLEVAAAALAPAHPASVSVLVTHALFLDSALERLSAAGIVGIWSTDSIPHATNRLPLADLLAASLTPRR